MKRLFYTKTLIALAVAVAAAAAAVSQAQEQPIPPPPATDTAMPPNIVPGSPLADVVKMIQAGVDPSTIKTYIANVQSPFNLDADTIIYLKDLGAPSDVINAMMDRDKALYASTVTPPPTPAPPAEPAPETAPPPTEVTVNYFNDTLTPYGTWVDVEGYGRCWRPTTVIYNSGWSPYCDGGHWVYTDCGWYWDSDYSWGVTFHYGRWFRSPSFGWCWYPDTVWAPSWVVWRSSDDYCGWAPLPPFAVFHPGVGFFYRGVSVGVDFDFGLVPDCFVFVPPHHFCDWHPRSFCVDHAQVTQVFQQTTVINNYTINNTTIVNHGILPDRIASVTHRPIEPVRVGSLPNAGRQGWRGEGFERTMHPAPGTHNSGTGVSPVRSNPPGNNNPGHNNPGHNFSSGNGGSGVGNGQFRHGPEPLNSPGNPPGAVHHDPSVPGSQLVHQTEPGHSPGQPPQSGNGSRGQPQTYVHQQPAQQPQPGNGNHGQPQTYVHQQPAQPPQPPARQNNTYAQPSHVTPQNQWQQPQQQYQPPRQTYSYPDPNRVNSQNQWPQNQNQRQPNQWQQNRNDGTAFPDYAQQHGAVQSQQRQYVPSEGPRQEYHPNYGEPQGHYSQPPPQPAPQGQPQPRNPGNGGGANNGNGNGNGGSNRQNQNH